MRSEGILKNLIRLKVKYDLVRCGIRPHYCLSFHLILPNSAKKRNTIFPHFMYVNSLLRIMQLNQRHLVCQMWLKMRICFCFYLKLFNCKNRILCSTVLRKKYLHKIICWSLSKLRNIKSIKFYSMNHKDHKN